MYDIKTVAPPDELHSTHRQKTPTNESEQEPSDDNEDDWSYHIGGNKKMKKDKSLASNSPRRGGNNRGPGRPNKLVRESEEMSSSSQLGLPKVSVC